jgi:hypothetical protein
VIVSSDTSTRAILGSVLTAVLMPSLSNSRFVIYDYPSDFVEFSGREPSIPGERHRVEPELGLDTLTPHMHVDRLATVEAVEKEPVRSGNASDPRHADVPALMFSGVRVRGKTAE